MITKKNIVDISNHIVCLVILMNILQIGLSGFNIHFNMFHIEYFLILILFIINKFKIKNNYNVILLIVVAIIFLLNIALNDTTTLSFYIQQFIYFALPLILVFLLEYNYEKLFTLFYKYCLLTTILYLLNIGFKTNLTNDYMTLGYNGVFCSTYIMITSMIKKNKKMFIFSLISGLIFFINGSRGSVLILILAIIIFLLYNVKNNKQKILLLLCSITIIFFGDTIIKNIINTLTSYLGDNYYTIRQLDNMINENNTEGIIGDRYSIYIKCIDELESNYLFGTGIASFQDKYNYFPHNIVLDVYLTFGIIIGTIYFIILIVTSIKTYIISKKSENYNIKIFFIFCISIIVKLMLSKTFIYDPYIWLLIASFLNIICSFKNKTNIQYLTEVNNEK